VQIPAVIPLWVIAQPLALPQPAIARQEPQQLLAVVLFAKPGPPRRIIAVQALVHLEQPDIVRKGSTQELRA
jgi:hypothetical protein